MSPSRGSSALVALVALGPWLFSWGAGSQVPGRAAAPAAAGDACPALAGALAGATSTNAASSEPPPGGGRCGGAPGGSGKEAAVGTAPKLEAQGGADVPAVHCGISGGRELCWPEIDAEVDIESTTSAVNCKGVLATTAAAAREDTRPPLVTGAATGSAKAAVGSETRLLSFRVKSSAKSSVVLPNTSACFFRVRRTQP